MGDPFTVDQLEVASRLDANIKILVEVDNSAVAGGGTPYTWRYCSGMGITYSGDRYENRGVAISASGRGGAETIKMTIKVDNRDKVLGEDMVAAKRTIGATCTVTLLTRSEQGVFEIPIVLMSGRAVRAAVHDDISIESSVLYGQRREASLMKGSRGCGNAYVNSGSADSKLCQNSNADGTCLRTAVDCASKQTDLRHYNGFLYAPLPGSSIPVGNQIVKVPSARTNWYQTGDWSGNSTGVGFARRFIADGYRPNPRVIEEGTIIRE